ncbi:hypothetical protein MHBO_005007 [Bonamia ostreae]|uniref:LIM zinc-binding domain-containing protein n=1 Tax=Bonamia ostreae TaxID=126728 RepID=A0ABV2AUT5_9EUKA
MYVGYEWRVKKGKQTYKYPEDLSNKGKTFRCNYCGKKSYPAETATYERIPYHQSCFRCLMCNKKLTTGSSINKIVKLFKNLANATPFGEEVFLCDTHFERFGQGGGFPKKNEKVEKVEEVKEDDDEMANLSAVERRRLRRKRMKEKKNGK